VYRVTKDVLNKTVIYHNERELQQRRCRYYKYESVICHGNYNTFTNYKHDV